MIEWPVPNASASPITLTDGPAEGNVRNRTEAASRKKTKKTRRGMGYPDESGDAEHRNYRCHKSDWSSLAYEKIIGSTNPSKYDYVIDRIPSVTS